MNKVTQLRAIQKTTSTTSTDDKSVEFTLDGMTEQLRQIQELAVDTHRLTKLVHGRNQQTSSTATAVWEMLRNTLSESEPLEHSERRRVSLSALYERGAIFIAIFSLAALVTCQTLNIPLVHPILSVIGLICAPFLYAMGRISRS